MVNLNTGVLKEVLTLFYFIYILFFDLRQILFSSTMPSNDNESSIKLERILGLSTTSCSSLVSYFPSPSINDFGLSSDSSKLLGSGDLFYVAGCVAIRFWCLCLYWVNYD
jgi:hypothetical protein